MKVTKIFISLSVALLLIFSCANPSLDSGAAYDLEAISAQVNDTSAIQSYSEDYLSNSANGEVREGYIWAGETVIKITYLRIDGVNVYQGDMLFADKDIYPTEEAAKAASDGRALVSKARLWANGRVNYSISASAFNKSIIRNAIAHIEARTKIRFTESATGNYINFITASGSWSYVGCVGGKQDLSLADWATTGTAVHEILHALGVHHEHCRKDRDNYVIIHWSNIKAGTENNFRKATSTSQYDVGSFDFGSIMLYGPFGFAIDRTKPTITKKDGSTYTSQRDNMSATDIKGIEFLYGTGGVVNPTDKQAPTVPSSLKSSNVTKSSVSLSWTRSTDNVGVTGYKIYKNGVYSNTVTGTSSTVSGLSANTRYTFAVSAIDKAGNESSKSSSISVTTLKDGGGTTNPTTDWKAYTYYKVGDVVTFSGVSYKCRMAHTAYPGWTPVAVPALWSRQ